MKNYEKQNSLIVLRVILLSISLFWMILIFCFSAQNRHMSLKASDTIIRLITKGLQLLMGRKMQFTLMTTHHVYITCAVRKLAHMFIYFMLAMNIMLLTLTYPSLRPSVKCKITLLSCLCYAFTDEFHQYFIDGRLASFWDIFIDTCGVLAGMVCAFLIYCVYYTICAHLHKQSGA